MTNELRERVALARDAAADAADLLPDLHPVTLLAELERSGALTPTALTLPPDVTLDRYEAVGRLLGMVDSATRWWIGDWLLTGEIQFGEVAYQAIEALGVSEDTRMRYVNVAQRVPPQRRRADLTWTHHKHVAALEPDQQTSWLGVAQGSQWSASQLREKLREGREETRLPTAAEVRAAAALVVERARETKDGYLVPRDIFEAFAEMVT